MANFMRIMGAIFGGIIIGLIIVAIAAGILYAMDIIAIRDICWWPGMHTHQIWLFDVKMIEWHASW